MTTRRLSPAEIEQRARDEIEQRDTEPYPTNRRAIGWLLFFSALVCIPWFVSEIGHAFH